MKRLCCILYIFCLFLFLVVTSDSPHKITVSKSEFDFDFSQIFIFKETYRIVAIDSKNKVAYSSSDEGKVWKKIDTIPKGSALVLVDHPFDKDTLFILSDSTTHYISKDSGVTWVSFKVPYKPFTRGVSILSFNAARVGYIIYSGLKCDSSNSLFIQDTCFPVHYYTISSFLPNANSESPSISPIVNEKRALNQCVWMKSTSEFQSTADKSIICIEDEINSKFSERIYTGVGTKAIVSDNFFVTEKTVDFGPNYPDHILLGITVVNGFVVLGTRKKTVSDMDIFVSTDGFSWTEGNLGLPSGQFEQSYTILESSKDSLFVDVKFDSTHSALYRSNSLGTFFTKSLDYTSRIISGIVDVERVGGLEGVLIANQIQPKESISLIHKVIKSKISFDNGATWSFINPPEKDSKGKKYNCSNDKISTGECSLHLHSISSTNNPGKAIGVPSAPGILVGVGSVGSKLAEFVESDTFLSIDGGFTWKMIHEDAHMYEIVGSGSSIVLINDEGPISSLIYSVDRGESWNTHDFGVKFRVKSVISDFFSSSQFIIVTGTILSSKKSVVFSVNLNIWDKKCNINTNAPVENDDIELWSLGGLKSKCLMGRSSTYARRKPKVSCYMPNSSPILPITETCDCSRVDYECDYNFILNTSGECELSGPRIVPPSECKDSSKTYLGSSGYRKIPGNSCKSGSGTKSLDTPVSLPCPTDSSPSNPSSPSDSSSNLVKSYAFEFEGLKDVIPFDNSINLLASTKTGKVYYSEDSGKSWSEIDFSKVFNKKVVVLDILDNLNAKGRAYVYTSDNEIAFTNDFGKSWDKLKSLPSPANGLYITPILSFHSTKPDYLLFAGGTVCPGCYTQYYVSHNHGDTWDTVTTHAEKCVFSYSEKFKTFGVDSVVCKRWHYTDGSNNYMDKLRFKKGKNFFEIVVIDSRTFKYIFAFHKDKVGSIHDFFVSSKYLVYSGEYEDYDDNAKAITKVGLWVISKSKNPIIPIFPPNMPVGLRQQGFTLLQTTNGEILLDVDQSQIGADKSYSSWGTLLILNDEGTAFNLALEKTNRNIFGTVDVENVDGIKGALIANQIINTEALGQPGTKKQLRTLYSLDNGRTWDTFSPPNELEKDKSCSGCTLNLYSRTVIKNTGGLYGVSSAPGSWVGIGSVGTYLDGSQSVGVYWSRDAGKSWKKIFDGQMLYEWGDYGGILLMVAQDVPTNVVHYSLDSGKSFQKYKFSEDLIIIKMIINGFKSEGNQFLLFGVKKLGFTSLIQIDFSQINIPLCSEKPDEKLEKWNIIEPRPFMNIAKSIDQCIFGERYTFSRRKYGVSCRAQISKKTDKSNKDDDELSNIPSPEKQSCECSIKDYDCDEGFWLNAAGECELFGRDENQPKGCKEGEKYSGRSGYVKRPQSNCSGDKDLSLPVERICGRAGGISSIPYSFSGELADFEYFYQSPVVYARTRDDNLILSRDAGNRWENVKDFKLGIVGVSMSPYFKDFAVFITDSDTHYITLDESKTFSMIKTPAPPSMKDNNVFTYHPTQINNMIYLGRPQGCSINSGVENDKCHPIAYYSTDLGVTWKKIRDNIGKGGCVFSKNIKDQKLSNMMACSFLSPDEGSKYTSSSIVASDNWFSDSKIILAENVIDMVYTSEFLVMAKSLDFSTGLMQVLVSIDFKTTALAQFPGNKNKFSNAYTVLDSTNSQGFLTLHFTKNGSKDSEWGTIYTSNSNGTYFRKSIDHVNRNELGLVDYERCAGIDGVIISNILSNPPDLGENAIGKKSAAKSINSLGTIFSKRSYNKELQTVLTVDGGVSWRYLRPPAIDSSGKAYPCVSNGSEKSKCSLHLHGFTEVSDPQNIYSASGAVGLVMGLGNVGASLKKLSDSNLYLSRDAGYSWAEVKKGQYLYEFADHGAIIVIADKSKPIDSVEYSLDFGSSWNLLKLDFPNSTPIGSKISVALLTTEPQSTSRDLILIGKLTSDTSKTTIINLDFTGARSRKCVYDPLDEPKGKNTNDFELWGVETNRGKVAFGMEHGGGNNCVLGTNIKYFRKINDKDCYIGNEFEQSPIVVEHCACSSSDFECDYNFEPVGNDGKCVLVDGFSPERSQCGVDIKGKNIEYYDTSSGYRLIPLSKCDRKNKKSLRLDEPIQTWCPGAAQRVALFWTFVLPLLFFVIASFVYLLLSNPETGAMEAGKQILLTVTYAFIGIVDAIRNISVFQHQYRHVLPMSNSHSMNSGNETQNGRFGVVGDGNYGGASQGPLSSNIATIYDAARHSIYVSYGVIHDVAWESAIYLSNYLPFNYRMYIHRFAPDGPIAFEDISYNGFNFDETINRYNYNQVDEINNTFVLDDDENETGEVVVDGKDDVSTTLLKPDNDILNINLETDGYNIKKSNMEDDGSKK
ncbi:Vacuolar protein sorting/targeting protein 10 [Smittium mucronatum]|uniref:Vacuolar protein sorting/targeting protein 10 n=1 Tax=Smittium mucronatum TaxID=133383 RepID=A0A1R0H9E5_9FUNG|nr:Vacuolar protein sorting/targeting protein 10 [Smittium mucronatum]